MDDLKLGDKVEFDIDGSKEPGPHGLGVVTRLLRDGGIIVHPTRPLAWNAKMSNIRKAEVKK